MKVVTTWIADCQAPARDFFACLDAYNALLTCDHAGETIETPEICVRVAERDCPGALTASSRVCGALASCAAIDPAMVPPDADDDVFGAECRPIPQRFVVLGDSIAACAVVEGADCVTRLVANHLRDNYSPSLTYDSFARGGAKINDLTVQMTSVEGGPGHVAVWIFAIGNDIIQGSRDVDGWLESFSEVFAYFSDATRFPDGATFMLNGQYSPYDECAAGYDTCGPRGSPSIEAFLREVNPRLFLDPAVARPDTVAIDHYRDFPGHGVNADVFGCPHCSVDNTSWVPDGAHPNVSGNHHIAEKWFVAFEQMYGPACGL